MDVVRSWKDAKYRSSLTSAPDSPVGIVELPEADVAVAGGDADVNSSWGGTCAMGTWGCCSIYTIQ